MARPDFLQDSQSGRDGERCLAIDPSLREAIDRAVPLSEYAWKFRYPGVLSEPDQAETVEALAAARQVVAAIASRLPAEVMG